MDRRSEGATVGRLSGLPGRRGRGEFRPSPVPWCRPSPVRPQGASVSAPVPTSDLGARQGPCEGGGGRQGPCEGGGGAAGEGTRGENQVPEGPWASGPVEGRRGRSGRRPCRDQGDSGPSRVCSPSLRVGAPSTHPARVAPSVA